MISTTELRPLTLFRDCREENLAYFARNSADVRVETGDFVMSEGDSPSFFALISGTLDVLKTIGGQETQMTTYEPGEGFGEVPLLLGSAAVVGVRATSAARLARLDGTAFLQMMHKDEAFARGVLSNMANRISYVQQATIEAPAECAIYGNSLSAPCHELRDFLTRVRVHYDWVEREENDCAVQFADGRQLHSPSMREVADLLGLSDVPSNILYDVAIVGAGAQTRALA